MSSGEEVSALVAEAVRLVEVARDVEKQRQRVLHERDVAIRRALDSGVRVADVVKATVMSRSQVERIRDCSPRTGNRARPEAVAVRLGERPEGYTARRDMSDALGGSEGFDDDYDREPFDPGA